jgi:hypothetical protein
MISRVVLCSPMVGMNGSVLGQKSSLGITTVAEIYFMWRASISLASAVRSSLRSATEPLAKIHHRQPVLLDDQHLDSWLNGAQSCEELPVLEVSFSSLCQRGSVTPDMTTVS